MTEVNNSVERTQRRSSSVTTLVSMEECSVCEETVASSCNNKYQRKNHTPTVTPETSVFVRHRNVKGERKVHFKGDSTRPLLETTADEEDKNHLIIDADYSLVKPKKKSRPLKWVKKKLKKGKKKQKRQSSYAALAKKPTKEIISTAIVAAGENAGGQKQQQQQQQQQQSPVASLERQRELNQSLSFLKRKRRAIDATIAYEGSGAFNSGALNNSERDGDDASVRTNDDGYVSIDRASIRLDGIEVYAMVSALTIATSVSLYDMHDDGNTGWLELIRQWDFVVLFTNICILATSISTILAGLHSTLIFSLMTMYGRTAVGVGNDNGFLEFFKATGHIRYRGFQSFQMSLYSFLLQVVITMLDQVPMALRLIFGGSLMYVSYSTIYSDTESVIHLASKILFA